MKSMGYVLMAPLVNEVVQKEKSLDHCQAAITHLTRVGTNNSSMRHASYSLCLMSVLLFRLAARINSCTACLN